MRALFSRKKVFPELYLEVFNENYYRQVYSDEIGSGSPKKHFLKNIDSLKFDPSPLFNMEQIAEDTGLSAVDIMEKLCTDEKFSSESQSVSLALFRYFKIKIKKKLLKDICKSKDLVDSEFYLSNYPDVGKTWIPPHIHYSLFGCKEGRWPTADFDTLYYLKRYDDVRELDINPFVHFCEFGNTEGRFGNAQQERIWQQKKDYEEKLERARVFDAEFYLDEYPDVKSAGIAPLEHYSESGEAELRRPNELFHPEYYLNENEDVRKGGLSAFAHFREFGWKEKRNHFPDEAYLEQFNAEREKARLELEEKELQERLEQEELEKQKQLEREAEEAREREAEAARNRELTERLSHLEYELEQARAKELYVEPVVPAEIVFDKEYYLNENPDVAAAGIDPEGHYFSAGEAEGRCPNQYFSPTYYNRLSADVRVAGISPFAHFKDFGFWEGRSGQSETLRASAQQKKPLLFVGHDGIQAGSEVVLLEVIKWFYNHTDRKIKTLLLSPGPLASQYAKYSDCYVLPEYQVDSAEDLSSFLNADFEFCYINTVVAGCLFTMLEESGIQLSGSVITHVHEMEKVIRENESSFELLKAHTSHYISASPASSRDLAEHFGVDPSDISTVPAFIRIIDPEGVRRGELRQKTRDELGLPESAYVVAGCGTVYWRKGPDIFLDSAKALCPENPELHFVWIGPGPDLDETTASIPDDLKDRIHFVGSKDHASELLACADLFFLSSREDPFPLVVMEAAQHGVPSLCFDEATGITDFIQGDAGYIIPKIDTNDAIEALRSILSDRADVSLKGQQARARVLEQYTSEKQCLNIFSIIKEHSDYIPSVSVIVPFYNHEKFVGERLDTVLGQSIKDIEVILMDDLSTDSTVEVASAYLTDPRVRMEANKVNSGSPFKQWKKGMDLSSSDLVWIAEGDDACDLNFLSTLLPYFDDEMMAIVSAKTEIIDEHSTLKAGVLMPYLDSAYQDKYRSSFKLDGYEAISQDLGAVCTLVNASAMVLRKSTVMPDVLDEAGEFKMCGDWYLYISMLKQGKLAYDVNTTNYFRRHSASQVNKVEGTDVYFMERYRITEYAVKNFFVDRKLLTKAFKAMDGEWERFQHKPKSKDYEDYYDKAKLKKLAKYSKKHGTHVAFYVHGMFFSKGGIERLVADIANYLAERGYKVTIFCRQWGKASRSVYPLYDDVDVVGAFDENNQEVSIKNLRAELLNRDVDLFIPMLSEWLFAPIVAAVENTGIPVVASEHNDPWKIEELWWSHEDRKECFSKVDKIHLLLDGFKASLPEDLQERVTVIPNGINMPDEVAEYSDSQRQPKIVAVGRLADQKRFDRLVQAVALVQNDLRSLGWQIEIWGEGQLRSDLESQIDTSGVADLVALKGVTADIGSELNKAALCVMPSEFEGFGIALAEAMSFGLPSLAFKDCNGPNELISHNKNGYLVSDVEELSQKLIELIQDDKKRESMSKAALRMCKKYDKDKVFKQWETLVHSFEKR